MSVTREERIERRTVAYTISARRDLEKTIRALVTRIVDMEAERRPRARAEACAGGGVKA